MGIEQPGADMQQAGAGMEQPGPDMEQPGVRSPDLEDERTAAAGYPLDPQKMAHPR